MYNWKTVFLITNMTNIAKSCSCDKSLKNIMQTKAMDMTNLHTGERK